MGTNTFEKFGEYYDLIYQFIDYEQECDVLEKIFAKFCQKRPKNILDIGCGTGSHALILSKRGYSVTGIDLSEVMIEKAKNKAEIEKLATEFLVQDMRNINLSRKFDCAICMFGAFGYMTTPEDLASFLSGLKQCLNKNGLFIFEFWSIGGLKSTPYQSWMKTRNEDLTLYRLSVSNFDPKTKTLKIEFEFLVIRERKLAETFTEMHKIRCYKLNEIQRYLESNQFKQISAYGWDFGGKTGMKKPQKDTFRVLAVARALAR